MARNSSAKCTYSVRLGDDVLAELQRRAREEKTSVGALIRRSIDNYLTDLDVSMAVAEMEHRIITTLSRSISQLDRHQLQTRRVADISLAQNEYLLFQLIANSVVKRQEGEDSQAAYRRIFNSFMRWLPGTLSSNGAVKKMIKQVMEPGFVVDEAPAEPSGESESDNDEASASIRGQISGVA